MKILHNASVYLVGKQVIEWDEVDEFLADHQTQWVRPEGDAYGSLAAAEDISELGGRLCYMSFATPRPGGNAAYLDNIKTSGHGSVLEHAVYNLLITGVSRTLTHELVRHRAGVAYSQLSQRYVDESVAEYVEPDIIASDLELHKLWVLAVASAHEAYIELVDKLEQKVASAEVDRHMLNPGYSTMTKTERMKTARQAARSVLPNACETKILFTANARAIRHFLEMRGSRFAEPEIRKLANQILELVRADSPTLFGDYTLTPLPDGTNEIGTVFRKV